MNPPSHTPSNTPRTDARAFDCDPSIQLGGTEAHPQMVVRVGFVRQLELENTALLSALEAQELLSAFSREMQAGQGIPLPNDPRYTPYIGEWDGYQAPEMRLTLFVCKRREMRTTVLSAAKAQG